MRFEPLEPRRHFASGTILFVRGADRSGGFLEANNDAERTEELADINNASTGSTPTNLGNHGWGTLAAQLRGLGYTVEQIVEPLERNAPKRGQTTGRAVAFQDLDLSQYAAVVMGSNNAVYGRAQVDALDAYVRDGGGVLFISDGNFGSSWADAPSSDNAFLGRYGLRFNQDSGGVIGVERADGSFLEPDAPILRGVSYFLGEGTSPVRLVGKPDDGVTARSVVRARGIETYDNDPTSAANDSRGTIRFIDRRDSFLALANAGAGRVAAYFDRNTFFNDGGAGTDITQRDNRRLATNLFGWVADDTPPAVTRSAFTQSTRRLTFRLDDNLDGSLTRGDVRLRDRRTGANVAGRSWSFSLVDGDGFTDVTIRIKPAVAAGAYALQIPRRALADDSGNVRGGAIRYAFTIDPTPATPLAAVRAATSSPFTRFENGFAWAGLWDE